MNFEAPNNKFDNKQILKTLEKIIFKLDKENIDFSVEQTMNLYVSNLPISFNNVISTLIYSAIKSNFEEYKTYINYLRLIQENEEKLCCSNPKMIDMFVSFITEKKTNESIFLVINMIEENIIDASKIKKQFSLGLSNYNKLDKEGVNPSEIAKIIRNDEIEKLQEISSQNDFDFNQTIEPSLYERCSFINNWKVTLIDYAAFFGSVKCFKFLLMNGAKVENTGKYAIAGGNEKIIHLCEQNHSTFEDAYETAIKFHRNDIFKYLYENKFGNIDNNLLCSCVTNGNYEIFSF